MTSINWSKFISGEVLFAVIGLAIAGSVAWSNVKSDIAVLQSADEMAEQHNKERYEDLKAGQKHMQDLLERMLLTQKHPGEG